MTGLYKQTRCENKMALGFGVEVMKTMKICTSCGYVANSSQQFCNECGAELPKESLYEMYAKRHRRCDCGVVVADSMNYCPSCGKLLPFKTSKAII